MKQKPFLKPRLVGARFEENAIPLEFLKDLAVLEEMVIEVAKWKFLHEHPTRQRVPRGFTEGIALKLTGVEGGSAIPAIDLFAESDSLFLPDNVIYFEKARDSIIDAIGAATQNQSITDHIPEKTFGYFDRIGRSLRDEEAIEFSVQDRPSPTRLTKETRRKLVLASTKTKEFAEETSVIGSIPEADQDNMTFEIMINGQKVEAPMAIQHAEVILDAFNKYKMDFRLQLQGVGIFSRQGKLQKFESIEHISLLDPLDVAARLDELRCLRDGWFEGKGIAPEEKELDWLLSVFKQFYPGDLPLPFLYPTVEGGIQAEWSLDPYEISLEIDLGERKGEWHRLDTLNDKDENRVLNLGNAQDWQWLVEQIKRIAEGTA
jgi:hypothetical protein